MTVRVCYFFEKKQPKNFTCASHLYPFQSNCPTRASVTFSVAVLECRDGGTGRHGGQEDKIITSGRETGSGLTLLFILKSLSAQTSTLKPHKQRFGFFVRKTRRGMSCTLKDKFKLFIKHNLQVSNNLAKAVIFCLTAECYYCLTAIVILKPSASVIFYSPDNLAKPNNTVRSTIKLRSDTTRRRRIKLRECPLDTHANELLYQKALCILCRFGQSMCLAGMRLTELTVREN